MRRTLLIDSGFSRTRHLLLVGGVFAGLLGGCAQSEDGQTPPPAPPTVVNDPASYVVPFIGSGGFAFRHGSAFPGATAPHGLVKVGPDTSGPFGTVNFLHYSGYYYGDDTVQGFSHMHLHGTGATDYGVLGVMPLDAWQADRTTSDRYGAKMRKDTEIASPGYYAVTIDRGDIRVELTASTHAAHHRYQYGAAVKSPVLLFDLDHHLESGMIDSAEVHIDAAKQRITGKLHSLGGMSRGYGGYEVYFVARVNAAWRDALVWSQGTAPASGTQATGTGVGLALLFADSPSGSSDPRTIEMQVGLSLVSEANAAANLDTELGSAPFETTQKSAADAWAKLLKTVRLTGGSESERRMFYSALYRAFLMPSIHSDSDGSYLGFDGKVQQADGYRYVSDLSLWDTYRTLHPLYSLIAPDDALDAVKSLTAMAKTSGHFPKWTLAGGDSGTMIGAPAELVIADAYLKGLTQFDAEDAYQILRGAAMDPTSPAGGRGGRDHVEDYMQYGYVPSFVSGSVSWTTEYARGDFALGQLAQALGHGDDAMKFADRAHSYQKLYEAKSGFLRGRATDGTFSWMPFDPKKYTDDYVEANGWQSFTENDHDDAGLIAMIGSKDAFVSKLNDMFDITRMQWEADDQTSPPAGTDRPEGYWAGNEVDIATAYLFTPAGRPDLTDRWVRWLQDTQYADAPAGLPGNDDGGTMSAWYIFSAMGIYPIVGSDRYVVSAPRFPRLEVAVDKSGGLFTIDAPAVSADKPYVQAVTLDGVPLEKLELRHGDLRAGRTLHFEMGATPPPAK